MSHHLTEAMLEEPIDDNCDPASPKVPRRQAYTTMFKRGLRFWLDSETAPFNLDPPLPTMWNWGGSPLAGRFLQARAAGRRLPRGLPATRQWPRRRRAEATPPPCTCGEIRCPWRTSYCSLNPVHCSSIGPGNQGLDNMHSFYLPYMSLRWLAPGMSDSETGITAYGAKNMLMMGVGLSLSLQKGVRSVSSCGRPATGRTRSTPRTTASLPWPSAAIAAPWGSITPRPGSWANRASTW